MSSVAIITARGGSKRIPRKNIKSFAGRPIIAYSIAAALDSGLFEEVMVSTDDHEIAEISIKYGAKIPFFRSEKNSDDYSTTVDVLLEVLDEYQSRGRSFRYGCCIYPTAPFVTQEKLKEAFEKLDSEQLDTVLPVVPFGFPVQRSLQIIDGKLKPKWPGDYLKRSQDLEPSYHDAGQFYWFSVESLLQSGQLVGENTGGMIVDENSVQDIDTEVDWALAEMKYRLMTGE